MSIKIINQNHCYSKKEKLCFCCDKKILKNETYEEWNYFEIETRVFHSIDLCSTCARLIDTISDTTKDSFITDVENMIRDCVCVYCHKNAICLEKNNKHIRCKEITSNFDSQQKEN